MSGLVFPFSALYLELIDSTHMISALLAGITDDESRLRPSPASWSILETLCHLCDEERLDFRPRLDVMLHSPGATWEPIDPEGWVASRRYNQQEFTAMKDRFFSERNKSLDWLRGVENAAWAQVYQAPFGALTAGDMLASWVAHDNLSVRQLVELRHFRLQGITRLLNIDYAGDW